MKHITTITILVILVIMYVVVLNIYIAIKKDLGNYPSNNVKMMKYEIPNHIK
jgi:NADH:ubiquinone oxidoreductase subunit 3 (subunit A)